MDISHLIDDKEVIKDKKVFKNVSSLMSLSFETGKKIILEFYIENFKAD